MDNFDLRAFLANNPLLEQVNNWGDQSKETVLKRRQAVNDYLQEFDEERQGLPELLRKLGVADDVENYMNKFGIKFNLEYSDFMSKESMKRFFLYNHDKVDSGELSSGTAIQNYLKWWDEFGKGKSDDEQPVYVGAKAWDDWVNGEYEVNPWTLMNRQEWDDSWVSTDYKERLAKEKAYKDLRDRQRKEEFDEKKEELVARVEDGLEHMKEYVKSSVDILTGEAKPKDGRGLLQRLENPDAIEPLTTAEHLAYNTMDSMVDDPEAWTVVGVISWIFAKINNKLNHKKYLKRKSDYYKDYDDMTENIPNEENQSIDLPDYDLITKALQSVKTLDTDKLSTEDLEVLNHLASSINKNSPLSKSTDRLTPSLIATLSKIPGVKKLGIDNKLKDFVKSS